jgi:Protein of unknown function (DUF3237)
MSEETYVQHAIESLMVLTAQTRPVGSVAGTQLGDRMIFDVVSGTFEGPLLAGRVAAGGDWVTRTPTGSRLDVRLLLETDDGATLLFQYSGRACQIDGEVRIHVAGTFDAPQGPYGWLNDVQAFGSGAPIPGGVRYHFYRFKGILNEH